MHTAYAYKLTFCAYVYTYIYMQAKKDGRFRWTRLSKKGHKTAGKPPWGVLHSRAFFRREGMDCQHDRAKKEQSSMPMSMLSTSSSSSTSTCDRKKRRHERRRRKKKKEEEEEEEERKWTKEKKSKL
jgi:hypothetical protein